jgi:hypothetical protein
MPIDLISAKALAVKADIVPQPFCVLLPLGTGFSELAANNLVKT